MKTLISLVAALVLFATTATAQVPVTYTFNVGDVIYSSQVNTNFNDLASNALNRAGGTLTGNLVVSSGVTIDGIDISAYLNQAVLTTSSPSFAGLTVTGALAANGGITVDSTAFTVADITGNVTGGTYNGQTISSAASFTGTVAVAGTLSPAGLVDASGASAGQFKFPGTQNASSNANTLDDYEEGTWLPVIGGDGGTSGQSYEIQSGHYVKIGKVVVVDFYVKFTNKGTITGDLRLQSLPFTAVTAISNGDTGGADLKWGGLPGTWVSIRADINGNSTNATIAGLTAAATGFTVLTTSNVDNDSTFGGTLVYVTSQ